MKLEKQLKEQKKTNEFTNLKVWGENYDRK